MQNLCESRSWKNLKEDTDSTGCLEATTSTVGIIIEKNFTHRSDHKDKSKLIIKITLK